VPIGQEHQARWVFACVALLLSPALVQAEDYPQPGMALALSSGGAAGLAYLPMLRVFEALETRLSAIKQLSGPSPVVVRQAPIWL